MDANEAYFNKDAIISDEIYDMLVDFLNLNKNSKFKKSDRQKKILPKSNEYKLLVWIKRKKKIKLINGLKNINHIFNDKLDGISGSIVIKDGNIIFNTRGQQHMVNVINY